MQGAIAAGHELTARAGAGALERGGNAVDAVVAAGVMSWAAEPALTGPCGGGFVMVRPARSGQAALLDAFSSIPGRDLPAARSLAEIEQVSVPFDERTTQIFHVGSATCAVPGVVAGLHAAHRRHGRLPWRDLVLPAAEAAQAGVVTNAGQQRVLDVIEAILVRTPEARAIFAPSGRYVARGDRNRQPELAASIELLAERGPDVLYRGELARAMVRHQDEQGGRLTMADLEGYRPIWRRPLRCAYRGRSLITNPPPSSGGVLIAHMLALLDDVARALAAGEAPALRALAETMRLTARRRDREFVRLLHRGGLAAHMLDPAAIAAGRGAVRAALDGAPTAMAAIAADHGTTHVSVIDGSGNAAAFTASNGSHSGVFVPGTGLHLNNMMGEEDLSAGRHLRPGMRLTSMQAPSLLDRVGRVLMAVGSSGSNRLRSAITQVIVNVVEHGMNLDDAVSFPRVHVEGDRLDCEGGLDPRQLDLLEAGGERLVRFESLNLYFGGANAVGYRDDGGLEAAGDPRRECFGMVL
ncbi:MAG: gamma-glutamyltranspeptidase / glutathione hydrolase [Gaiellales bacterium]|nr:gamma-glutamyltranspeptidase / glutathione hydrolase [Gaiellales bacterium]